MRTRPSWARSTPTITPCSKSEPPKNLLLGDLSLTERQEPMFLPELIQGACGPRTLRPGPSPSGLGACPCPTASCRSTRPSLPSLYQRGYLGRHRHAAQPVARARISRNNGGNNEVPMALGHISANWNDLDRAGSAGFQPARGTKSPLLPGPQVGLHLATNAWPVFPTRQRDKSARDFWIW